MICRSIPKFDTAAGASLLQLELSSVPITLLQSSDFALALAFAVAVTVVTDDCIRTRACQSLNDSWAQHMKHSSTSRNCLFYLQQVAVHPPVGAGCSAIFVIHDSSPEVYPVCRPNDSAQSRHDVCLVVATFVGRNSSKLHRGCV